MSAPDQKKSHKRALSTESIHSASSVGSINDRGARAKWGAELGSCLYGCLRCQWCRERCAREREEGDEGGGCSGCGSKTEADHESSMWRHELGEFLEHPFVYRPITALLLIDVLFIFAEFIIHDYHFIDQDWPHDVGYYIKCTSLSILVVFQIESFLTLTAFGLKFFAHPGFVLDGIVIPVSILMETVVSNDAAALLVLLRFWRLVRIVHGIYEAQMVQFREIKQELMKHKIVITKEASHLHHLVKHFDKKYKGLTNQEKLGLSTIRMETLPDAQNLLGGELTYANDSETSGDGDPEKGIASPVSKQRGTAKGRKSANGQTEITAVRAIPSTSTTE